MVTAPSARVAKRIAAPVWRCGRARSPGSSTVKAASNVLVVVVSAPNAGCAMINARRSMSLIDTSATERCSIGSTSRQRQMNGASGACGCIGVMRW
jgi:hypothetical protein